MDGRSSADRAWTMKKRQLEMIRTMRLLDLMAISLVGSGCLLLAGRVVCELTLRSFLFLKWNRAPGPKQVGLVCGW